MPLNPSQVLFDVLTALTKNSELTAVNWINLRIGALKDTIFFDVPNWAVTAIEFVDDQGKTTRDQFIAAPKKRIMLWLQPTTRLLVLSIEKGKTKPDFYLMKDTSYGVRYIFTFNYYRDTAIRISLIGSSMPKTTLELSELLKTLPIREPHEYWEWPNIQDSLKKLG
jgi:hypothetical protein